MDFRGISLELCLPYLAGAVVFILGVIGIRREFSTARGVDRIICLGPMFLAIPMAVYGADHFVFTGFIVRLVPKWIPGHLFWVLLIGICLITGALSLALRRYATLAAASFGTMLFLFVLLLWIPGIVHRPSDRFAWGFALRDLAWGAGALSFAAAQAPARWTGSAKIVLTVARVAIGVAAVFFGVEHFLHPEFKPGLVDQQLTPLWIPARLLLAYLTGVVLLITGMTIALNKGTKLAAVGLGLMLLLLAVLVYLPVTIGQPAAIDSGLNFLAGMLLFSGSLLCLAGSYRARLTPYEENVTVYQKDAGIQTSI